MSIIRHAYEIQVDIWLYHLSGRLLVSDPISVLFVLKESSLIWDSNVLSSKPALLVPVAWGHEVWAEVCCRPWESSVTCFPALYVEESPPYPSSQWGGGPHRIPSPELSLETQSKILDSTIQDTVTWMHFKFRMPETKLIFLVYSFAFSVALMASSTTPVNSIRNLLTLRVPHWPYPQYPISPWVLPFSEASLQAILELLS